MTGALWITMVIVIILIICDMRLGTKYGKKLRKELYSIDLDDKEYDYAEEILFLEDINTRLNRLEEVVYAPKKKVTQKRKKKTVALKRKTSTKK